MKRIPVMLVSLLCLMYQGSGIAGCGTASVSVQVLGSGGPELGDGRASSGYVIWHDGRARLLLDAGGGSAWRFEQSGANVADLDAILLTHLHVDHSNDLPVLVKASFFSGRTQDLPVFGPTGNQLMPSTSEFIRRLFGGEGAYRYLSGYLEGRENYRLTAHDIDASGTQPQRALDTRGYQATAIAVHHGPIPALAWRIDVDGRAVVISGDMNNDKRTLERLARDADVLIAHHAIPESAGGVARNLHMPPSEIGKIARNARVKKVVLSHRMKRTVGREEESLRAMRRNYAGPVVFANDLDCF